nr:hypothetical protein Iba_chr12bCG9480 [Ipomoea batatas]
MDESTMKKVPDLTLSLSKDVKIDPLGVGFREPSLEAWRGGQVASEEGGGLAAACGTLGGVSALFLPWCYLQSSLELVARIVVRAANLFLFRCEERRWLWSVVVLARVGSIREAASWSGYCTVARRSGARLQ